MEERMEKVAVVFLAWMPGGPEDIYRFLGSYRKYPAGIEHDLILVIKGEGDIEASDIPHQVIRVPDEGYDINSYISVAEMIQHEYVYFLNTHAEFLCDHWLEITYRAMIENRAGVVGATGSYEASPLGEPLFPNPHVRTTGFLLNRKRFLEWNFKIGEAKIDSYRMENGVRSIANRCIEENSPVLIVGKNGRAYSIPDWPNSGIYRQGNQENLILHDTHTRHFQNADKEERKRLSVLAWGEEK